MKTTLNLLPLVIAAGFPCVAFAEFIGAPVSASANAGITLAVFAFVIGAMIVARDYLRPLPSLVSVEDHSAVAQRRSAAYGIRRGSGMARLSA